MHFEKGNPGGPGRPKGQTSPYTVIKNMIVKIFLEEGQEKFEAQMRNGARKNPIGYYLKFIEKDMPKAIELSGNLDVNQMTNDQIISKIDELLTDKGIDESKTKCIKKSNKKPKNK